MRTNSDSSGRETPTGGETPFWIELPLSGPEPPAETAPSASDPAPDADSLPAFVAADPAIEMPATAPVAIAREPDEEESSGVATVIPIVLGGVLAIAIAIGLEVAGLWSTLLPP